MCCTVGHKGDFLACMNYYFSVKIQKHISPTWLHTAASLLNVYRIITPNQQISNAPLIVTTLLWVPHMSKVNFT